MWRYLFLMPVCLLSTALPLAGGSFANLEYEYALAASYLALLLIPAAAFFLPARHLPVTDGAYRPPVGTELLWIFVVSPAIGLLSGLYMFAAGICDCSRMGFLFWMVILWYPAWILAHAIHHGVARARVQGIRRRVVFGTLALVYGALVLGAALTMWLAPQKRIVDLLLGFLHGPIYDAWIVVDSGIVLARAAHLALACALLSAVWWRRHVGASVAVGLCTVLWLGLGLAAGTFESTRNGKGALDAILSARLEGQGFTMHYQPRLAPDGTPETQAPAAVARLFRDTEFHLEELGRTLAEPALPKVEIYVYPSNDQKKLWFGGGATDVTDVRTPSVHLSLGTWPHPTLRHELAHALTSDLAFHGLGFHPNMAFTEGLAVALAPEARSLSLDDGAAALLRAKRLPPMAELFSPAFWKVAGNRAYTAAGSFLKYLIATHGIEGVKALYSGKSWEEAFGKSRDTLVQGWQEHIERGYDAGTNALFAEALYRRPGILDDQCPHSKVDLARGRDQGAYVRMRQPVGWDPDTDYLSWLSALDEKDTAVRLRVWRQEIRRVASERFSKSGRLETWREALAKGRQVPSVSLEDVEGGILESDVARVLGDVDGSIALLTALAEEGKRRFFGDGLTREIEARLAIERLGADQALEWRRYLAGFRRHLPDGALTGGPWILTYLKLRNLKNPSVADLRRLLTDAPPDGTLSSSFHLEWYRILGERLMKHGAFSDAAAAYDQAVAVARPAAVEVYAEHARRARFYKAKGPLTTALKGKSIR